MKLRKILLGVAAAAAMSTACYAQDINVSLNGNIVNFPNQKPVVVEGRTLIPLRGVFDNMGYDIGWDGETKTVTLTKGSDTITISIGQASYTLNGVSNPIDVPAQIINGSTMLPLRAIADATGAEVLWDGETKIATILDDSIGENAVDEVQVLLNNQAEADAVEAYSNAVKELDASAKRFADFINSESDKEDISLENIRSEAQKAYDDAVAVESRINAITIPARYNEVKTSSLEFIKSYEKFAKFFVDLADGNVKDFDKEFGSIMTEFTLSYAKYAAVVEGLK